MIKAKHIIIIALLIATIAFSGCAERDDTDMITNGYHNNGNDSEPLDEVLIESMVGITEKEIDELEEMLTELETLINDMDFEDIEIEDI